MRLAKATSIMLSGALAFSACPTAKKTPTESTLKKPVVVSKRIKCVEGDCKFCVTIEGSHADGTKNKAESCKYTEEKWKSIKIGDQIG